MSKIMYVDTDGTKGILPKATLGYDDYPAGGDEGRVAVGTGSKNVYLAKQEEVEEAREEAVALAIALG